ncbi:MAG: class I SAM-dependent methyltransferase, partial [Planctomycetota bacterium]
IEHARGAHGDVANLGFELGDFSALKFDREFDVVFSNAALHWVRDHGPVLKGIADALKPGGKALLQMAGRGNARGVLEVVETVRRSPVWDEYIDDFTFPFGFWGPMDYGRWLIGSGLRGTRMELIAKEMTQDGADGLAGWIRTTWLPYTQRVPGDRRDAFVDEIVTGYIDRHGLDDDGRVTVEMVRFEAELVREG